MTAIRLLPLLGLALLAAACDREKQETPATLASHGTPVPTVAASATAPASPR